MTTISARLLLLLRWSLQVHTYTPASLGWTFWKYSSAPEHTGRHEKSRIRKRKIRLAGITWSHDRDVTAVRRTLLASVGVAGDGPPVFAGPVEIVRRTARHLTPQGDGSALGRQHPLRVNPHHQGGRGCKGSKVETENRLRDGVHQNAQFGCTFAAKCVLTVIRAALLSFLRVADITGRAAEHRHTDTILSMKRFSSSAANEKKKKHFEGHHLSAHE